MILYPKLYVKRITDIDINYFKENNIKGLMLDVDNTLYDFNKNYVEGLEKWIENVKKEGIKILILSNSNKEDKVSKVAKKIGAEYILFAMKPLTKGFKEGLKKLNLKAEEVAEIGDQVFTDVLGSNLCKIHSILVEPMDTKDYLITKIKRPLENCVINSYKRKRGI